MQSQESGRGVAPALSSIVRHPNVALPPLLVAAHRRRGGGVGRVVPSPLTIRETAHRRNVCEAY